MTRPLGQALGLVDWHVPQVLYVVTERCHTLVEVRHTHRRGSHVDAAAARTEIERRSNNCDLRSLHVNYGRRR